MTEISVFRPGDVSYLRIAAPDPARSAAFYSWKIRQDSTAFEDGTGHLIGHFMAYLPVAAAKRASFPTCTSRISTGCWPASLRPPAR